MTTKPFAHPADMTTGQALGCLRVLLSLRQPRGKPVVYKLPISVHKLSNFNLFNKYFDKIPQNNRLIIFNMQAGIPKKPTTMLVPQQMVPSSAGLTFLLVEDVRLAAPKIFLELNLNKVAIAGLNRAQMKDILVTADETTDAIVEQDNKRLTLDQATEKWREIVTEMGWNSECKEYIFTVSGNYGKISNKTVAAGKTVAFDIESLSDGTPILFDSDWFDTLKSVTRKRPSHDITWSEAEAKKQEEETEANRNLVPQSEETEDKESQIERLKEQLEEAKLKGEERERELTNYYKNRVQVLQSNLDAMAEDNVQTEELEKKRIESLQTELQTQRHDMVIKNQEIENLKKQTEQKNAENADINQQLAELRESIQSIKQERLMKQEPKSVSRLEKSHEDWEMVSDSDDEEPIPSTSTPKTKKISQVTKSDLPASLTKLGMSVYNPLKHDKIEYLLKFITRTKDFNKPEDLKFKKNLLYQALADDSKFIEEELTEDDLKDMKSLIQAIINQEYGDSLDLMKKFERTQIRQGESHKKYFFRVTHLYQLTHNLSDQKDAHEKLWTDYHNHALKIYFKIEDSLPSGPKAKFNELMMESRNDQTMTVKLIQSHLFDTILKIYKDDLIKAMGSQAQVLPQVDAIKSRNKERQYQTSKVKDRKCWICNETSHQKKDCPNRYNRRETKTKPGSQQQGVQCYTCGGKGHYSRECATKRNSKTGDHPKWSGRK